MEKNHIVLLIFFSFLLKTISGADLNCSASCSPTGPQVHFPFHIIGRQSPWCGFPGFDLSCDKNNNTILRLPSSRSYIVKNISYESQAIYLEQDFCRPNHIVEFNLSDTPFYSSTRRFTFYNCSLQNFRRMTLPCPSSLNYSVIASRTGWWYRFFIPRSCQVMKTIRVPDWRSSDIGEEVELRWSTPYCRFCEIEGRDCELSEDGQIVCIASSRREYYLSPRDVLIVLVCGVVGCIIGIGCVGYIHSRGRDDTETHHQSTDVLSIEIIPQPPPSTTGLDGPTIESHPNTVRGESCRLHDDDGICAICLSDYKPKESLRTTPECNHCFHANCIDEWLKLNATCPMCRKSLVTPCSSSAEIG